jgi:PAS domain S-box-containing protein
MNDPRTILQLVLDNIPQGVFWKDRNSVYLGCNRVICRTLGLKSPDELVGKSDFQIPSLTRDQAEGFVRIDRRVMESGRSEFGIVEPMNRFDGETIWVETNKVPLCDADGNVIGILGTWQNVTERQRAVEALRRSEQRHRSLVAAMSEMVWTSNAHGSQLKVEPPLEQFTGMSREEVRGAGWLNAVHPDDRAHAEETWNTAVVTGQIYECEFRLLSAEGEWRNIQSRGIPIRDAAGQVLEWVGVGVDVTPQRQAEARIRRLNDELEQRVCERTSELEAANKELEAFSYSVSHDLRAPLRAIDGFSRILLSDYAEAMPATAQEYLRDVREATQIMGQLIDDLLSFSRLGRLPLLKQQVDTQDLVKRCLTELGAQSQGRVIEFQLATLPDCWADPRLLKQAWLNLLSNALKYTSKRDSAHIEIGYQSSGPTGERAYFIRDNGVGFDMRYAHKLFGVFQRLHRSEDYEGTGVGLATVQRVIHRHGGRVWGDGAVDRGATFYFTLPEQGNIS